MELAVIGYGVVPQHKRQSHLIQASTVRERLLVPAVSVWERPLVPAAHSLALPAFKVWFASTKRQQMPLASSVPQDHEASMACSSMTTYHCDVLRVQALR